MSNDERYVYAIASVSDGSVGLYRYEIAAGSWSKVSELTHGLREGISTGGEMDPQGRIYVAHYNDDDGWVNLVQFDLNPPARRE